MLRLSGRPAGRVVIAISLFAGLHAAAEEKVNSQSVLPRVPAVDPAAELRNGDLLRSLRAGGFVLYLRHMETGEVTESCGTSNLTAAGREAARALGRDLKALKIPFDKVISSEVCRVRETADLLAIAPVETHEDLHRNPKREGHLLHEGRAKLLAAVPPAGKNRLLTGHMQNGKGGTDRLFLDMGEIIVFRPAAGGPPIPVARVRAGEWQSLINGENPARPK